MSSIQVFTYFVTAVLMAVFGTLLAAGIVSSL